MPQPLRNPWPALLIVCLGFFMIMLDTTIVYVATPSILTSLQTSLDSVLWVFNGYLLAYAVLLITAGRLGDLFGPRNLFAAGLVVFTAASALCGLSADANQLIAWPVLQGIGGALIEGQRYEWGTITGFVSIPLLLVVGFVLLALFVLWERRQDEPLVPLRLFQHRNYTLMNWTALAVAFAMQGIFLPFTIYLQSVLGMSALASGLTVAPLSLVSMFVAPFSGRLVDRFGGKYLLMAGLTLFATGTGMLFWLASPDSSWQTFVPPLMLAGLGMGCVFAPMTTIAMRDVTPRETGAASGVFNTMRQLGAVVGSAVIGAVLQAQLAIDLPAEASSAASGLPAQFRDQFVSGFAQAARGGFQVGVGQTGGAQLPPNLPAQVAAQIQAIARAVFERGFVDAMRPSAVVAIVVLLVAAAGCAFIVTSRRPAPAAERVILAAAD